MEDISIGVADECAAAPEGHDAVAEAAEYVRKLIPGADITLLPGYTGFPAKYDTTPIRAEIGYSPQWTLEQGIKKIIDEVIKQHNLR